MAEGQHALPGLLAGLPAGERVALVDPGFVGHRHSLRLGLTDPRFDAAAIPGALSVTARHRQALADACRDLDTGTAPGTAPAGPAVVSGAACLPDALAARLEENGTGIHRPSLGPLVAAVPATGEERARAEAALAATDEEDVRLRSAVKSRDGFFTTFCVSPYSRYLARWCARRNLTPNQVTTASLLTALAAAACAATGARAGYAAAAVLLLLSFVLDCTDGQLARYSLRYSRLGAWLDATFDRAKEYAYYAGLALGAARSGDDVWALALGAMVLMTSRHVVDFAFAESRAGTAAAEENAASAATGAAALSGRLDRIGWTVWARRMIVLPIGERWALIAVLTALTTPRVTLTVLLAAGGFAACYTTAGRLLRSLPALRRRERRHGGAPGALAALADAGPLAGALGRLAPRAARPVLAAPLWALAGAAALLAVPPLTGTTGGWAMTALALCYALATGLAVAAPLDRPLDWLLPPVFRAAEYGAVLLLAAHSEVKGALPAAYVLVAACAYHHYDTVYRLRGGAGAPPRWLVRTTGGQEGRALAVTAAAALWGGGQGFTVALAVLGGTVATVVLAESIRFWVSAHAPAVHDETGVPA